MYLFYMFQNILYSLNNINQNNINQHNTNQDNTNQHNTNQHNTMKSLFNLDNFNRKQYLYFLLPDSGPGNQIISIKEGLLLSKILNITFIIPNLHNHFLINDDFIDFKELYNLHIDENIEYYNKKYFQDKNHYIYAFREKRFNMRILSYKSLDKCKYKEIKIKDSVFYTKDHILDIKHLKQDIIIFKDFFLNLAISECGFNGCIHCKLNPNIEKEYKYICSKLDFSDTIKKTGDLFIKNNKKLQDKFISFHLRYPDEIKDTETLLEYTKKIYDDKKMLEVIIEKYKDYTIFIATNNQKKVNKLLENESIKDYKNNIILNTLDHKYNSWIEQYICTKSEVFISYPLNMYEHINRKHKCSTFSSFITDYRLYFLNLSKKSCINILDIYNPENE